MHIFPAIGITILMTTTPAQTQPTLTPLEPVIKEITFVNAQFANAIALLARTSGVTIELDESVTPDIRRHRVADMRLRDVKFEELIEELTTPKGLSYTVVDAKTIRIFKKKR